MTCCRWLNLQAVYNAFPHPASQKPLNGGAYQNYEVSHPLRTYVPGTYEKLVEPTLWYNVRESEHACGWPHAISTQAQRDRRDVTQESSRSTPPKPTARAKNARSLAHPTHFVHDHVLQLLVENRPGEDVVHQRLSSGPRGEHVLAHVTVASLHQGLRGKKWGCNC